MIRKTLLTLALTAGMVGGTAGIASAHECFVAKRSAQGNAAATNSANWYTLELAELFATGHLFFQTDALTPEQVDWALAQAAAAGVPTSFTLFERLTIPSGPGGDPTDGKGIDHFYTGYGDTIVGIFFAALEYAPPA